MAKKLILALLGAFLGLLLALACLMYWLLCTTGGSDFALQKAAELCRGTVNIEGKIASGNLAHGFKSEGVFKVEVPQVVTVSCDRLELSWSLWRYLSSGTIRAEKIKAQHLEVVLSDAVFEDVPDDEIQSDELENFRVNIPVSAVIEHLISNDFAFRSQVVDVSAQQLDLGASCFADYAGVNYGRLEGVDVVLKYKGEDDSTVKANKNDLKPAVFGPEGIETLLTIDLPLDTELRNTLIKNGRYRMQGFDTGKFDAYADASWRGHILKVDRASAVNDDVWASVKGNIDFSRFFKMNFKGFAKSSEDPKRCAIYKEAPCGVETSLNLSGDLTDLKLKAQLHTPEDAVLYGRINALSQNSAVELKFSANKFVYPFYLHPDGSGSNFNEQDTSRDLFKFPSSDPKILAENLEAKLSGSLENRLKLKVSGLFSGFGFNRTKLSLNASNLYDEQDQDCINIDGSYFNAPVEAQISGRLFDGYEALEAFKQKLLQEPRNKKNSEFSAKVKLVVSKTERLSSFLSGDLKLDSTFHIKNSEASNESSLSDLILSFVPGGLEAKLSCKELSYSDKGVDLEKFELSQGKNRIEASGNLSLNSKITALLQLPELEKLVPWGQGALSGRMQAKGELLAPDLELFLKSKDLKLWQTKLRGFTLNVRTDSRRKNGGITAFADSTVFADGLKRSRNCALDLSGSLKRHHLNLSCTGSNGGYMGVSGSFDDKTRKWQGTLLDLFVVTQYASAVNLVKAIPISADFNEEEVTFGNLMLRGQTGSLEFSKTAFKKGIFTTSFDLQSLDLHAFDNLYSDEFKASGLFNASGKVRIADGRIYTDASLDLKQGRIDAGGAFFDFERFKASAKVENNDLYLSLNTSLRRGGGELDAQVNVKDPAGRKTLFGNINLRKFNLRRLSAVGNGFNELEGLAEARFNLGGELEHPLFRGRATVVGSAEPRFDLGRAENFDLTLDADGSSGDIFGNFSINGGKMLVNGRLDWTNKACGQVHFSSDHLPLFLMGYGDCIASLGLDVKFDEKAEIKGNISIPTANIKISALGDAGIEPSKDEIVVSGSGGKALLKAHRQKEIKEGASIDVSIDLGNAVKLEAMGLKAQVAGGIKILKKAEDDEIRSSGKISLIGGKADLYGHRFMVSYADSFFDGNIANPKISAEVVADPSGIEDDVVAGVRISGRATEPEITLFSRPAMSQNEILSYLLYGHGLEKNSNDPESSSAQLLTALGLGTTSGLMNSVASALGMGNVQFGSSGSGEQTQIGVQTYLTNNIMISYGYGVFTSVGEFRLRYELMRRLYAEFVSSLDQAVDLIYSFEFD